MFNLEVFDLRKFIIQMTTKFTNIERVYLFGSRGYRTNSKRSDIDLLVVLNASTPTIDKTNLQDFQADYSPVDLFIYREYSAQSIVNNSEILKREGYKDLFNQLDAKLLWEKSTGFDSHNETFLKQEIITHQQFFPSYIPMGDPFTNFESVLHNCTDITNVQKIYLKEAEKCYKAECYLGFLSMMGTYFEDLLLSFCAAYGNRIGSVFSGDFARYSADVLGPRLGAKKRLENTISFIKSIPREESFFKANGIEALTEFETLFDIIRLYRNDIDHPNGIVYTKHDCDGIIIIFSKYVKDIYNIIKVF